jgi:steroid 5-alpha reductase family enzyme
MNNIYLISALYIFIFMNFMYLLALRLKDNSIVDIGWGIGFIIVALATLFDRGTFYPRQLLITAIIIVWGMRLAIYIFKRNSGKGEDFRYKQWRTEWGKTIYWRSYLQVFMLQGAIMFLIALPLMQVNASASSELVPIAIGITDFIGAAVWLIGFLFEAIGDAQMMRFKNNPANKGKIMRYGLWKYTRHPNYFGEALLWWGIFIIATAEGNIFISVISPLLLTYLLLKVSGVAMLEKKYTGNAEYDEYIRTTSSFVPMLPGK